MIDVKKNLFLMICLSAAFLLLLAVTSCGSPAEEEAIDQGEDEEVVIEEEEEAITEEVAEEQAGPLAVDEWQNPTDLIALLKTFEELEWTWTSIEDGIETDSFTVSYYHAGSETVNGVDTSIAVITFEGQDIKAWVDQDGNVAQVEIDGQIIPGEQAAMMLDGMVMSLFWPFWMVDEYDIRGMLEEPTPGVEWSTISTTQEQFNGVGAEVTRLQLELSPPATPEGEEATVIWAVADFADLQMLVEWRVEETEIDDFAFTMSVDKIVLR